MVAMPNPWINENGTAILEDESHIFHDASLPIQSSHSPTLHKSPSSISLSAKPQSKLDLASSEQPIMSLHSEDDSQDTEPTTISIAPLQDIDTAEGKRGYNLIDIDDPRSFDLVEPSAGEEQTYSLEKRADILFSKQHLEAIFGDARLFLKFTTFLSKHRPQSVPLLIYYLDSLKALKAIAYSNAIVDGLEATSLADFTAAPPKMSFNASLQEKSDRAFALLTQEDLPAYITHIFVEIVSSSIHRKITGTMAPQLLQASEGLAEVFCMSDMSKPDNPIVFSSEEFHRTTQYGLNYAIGRNCRFLQGPRTTASSVRRLREAIRNGREHQETFLNYRRDGSPFMNLLTMAPLLDNQGKVRYYIGAQVDVSGLVKECTNLEALTRLVAEQESQLQDNEQNKQPNQKKDEFQSLSEMFNQSELETVRLHGGRMHSEQHELDDGMSVRVSNRPRLLIREPSPEEMYKTRIDDDFIQPQNSNSASTAATQVVGRLPGVFAHYLIIRPYPSLRITFTSPSLRVPGLLQSPFLSRIGGSPRVREELTLALSEGRNVTAKVRWLNVRYDESSDGNMDEYHTFSQAGKPRWIHCTPLLSSNRAVGAWMIIMIDGEDFEQTRAAQAERIGVVSPSFGRGPQTSGSGPGPRSRLPTGRPSQNVRDPSPVTGASSTNTNEWDLDLDIATASVQQHQHQQPLVSNNHISVSSNRTAKPRSQSSALTTGPVSPPPKSIPPPPVSDNTLPQHGPGFPDPSRGHGDKAPARFYAAPASQPSHNSYQYRTKSPSPALPIDQAQSRTLPNGHFDHAPQPPPVSTSECTVHSFTIAPLVGSISTSNLTTNPAVQHPQAHFPPQPQSQPQAQSQSDPQSQQPPPSIPLPIPPSSPRDFQPPPRLHAKTSTSNMTKKPHASFGQRVFHGFRKGSDREKDKEKEKELAAGPSIAGTNTTDATNATAAAATQSPYSTAPPKLPLVISAPILQSHDDHSFPYPYATGAVQSQNQGMTGQRAQRSESNTRNPSLTSTSRFPSNLQGQAQASTDYGSASARTSDDRYTLT